MAYQFETKTVELLYGYKDEEGNVHKEAEIREITGADEEVILRPDVRSNIGRLITQILCNCVVRIGDFRKSEVNATKWEKIMKELFIGDRDLLMMEIRKFTYGEDVEIPFRCHACKSEGKHILEWDEIEIIEPKTDPFNIPFELRKGARDKDGNIFKEGLLRMPNGLDQEVLDTHARKNMGKANTVLIQRCVHKLGDLRLSAKVFENLSLADREKIVEAIANNQFGPNFNLEIECPSCGEPLNLGVHPVNFL